MSSILAGVMSSGMSPASRIRLRHSPTGPFSRYRVSTLIPIAIESRRVIHKRQPGNRPYLQSSFGGHSGFINCGELPMEVSLLCGVPLRPNSWWNGAHPWSF